jgi:hypothetical protein
MTFDITKPYRCRNGAEAKVVEGPDGRLYGWYSWQGETRAMSWPENGCIVGIGEASFDLVNIPLKRTLEVWVNLYRYVGYDMPTFIAFSTKELADADRSRSDRIACLHIVREYEDGEGLTP